jgi:hypothetical protein
VTKKEEKRVQLNVVGAVTGINFQKKQSEKIPGKLSHFSPAQIYTVVCELGNAVLTACLPVF